MDHPARYALVELVNLHDPGLEFEAIHRVLFNVDVPELLNQADIYYRRVGTPCLIEWYGDHAAAVAAASAAGAAHAVALSAAGRNGLLKIDAPELTLEVATLQNFLDEYLKNHPGARIDYIHGEEAVTRLGGQEGNLGFYLPSISKHDLFRTIVRDGALPRKTFSMGEADEKRFYLEARRITL
jgi:hypothetical protein